VFEIYVSFIIQLTIISRFRFIFELTTISRFRFIIELTIISRFRFTLLTSIEHVSLFEHTLNVGLYRFIFVLRACLHPLPPQTFVYTPPPHFKFLEITLPTGRFGRQDLTTRIHIRKTRYYPHHLHSSPTFHTHTPPRSPPVSRIYTVCIAFIKYELFRTAANG